jgi:hypothetical protein
MRGLVRRPHLPLLSDTDRAFLVVCGPDAGPSGGMTGELLTLPRPSDAVRRRASAQVDVVHLSAGVLSERPKFKRLAVDLAVSRRCVAHIPMPLAEGRRQGPGRAPGRPQVLPGLLRGLTMTPPLDVDQLRALRVLHLPAGPGQSPGATRWGRRGRASLGCP